MTSVATGTADGRAAPSHDEPSGNGRRYLPRPLDLRQITRRYRRTQYINVLMPFILLGVWELVSGLDLIDARFFSAPSDIVVALVDLARSGELWVHVGATSRRVVVGFLWGGAAGVLVGVLMARSWVLRAVLKPVVAATYPVPKIALLPVFLLIFGIGDTSIYVVVAMSVFYVTLINTLTAVTNIPSIYQDVAQTFDVRGLRHLTSIALPGALPVVFSALRVSLGIALVVAVAAEFTSADEGLGKMIINSWQIFSIERMYAALVLTGVLGWASFLVMDLLERFVIPWRREIDA